MTKREALLKIHEQLDDFVAHKIEATSLCMRIKNIINEELKPKVYEKETDLDLFSKGFVKTQPELAKAAAECPYGGVTGRPRRLMGYISLPDGRRFFLGDIWVKFDGWGDGCITEVDMLIHADKFEETEDEI